MTGSCGAADMGASGVRARRRGRAVSALGLLIAAMALLGLASQDPPNRSPAQQFEAAVTLVEGRGDCPAAVPVFETVAAGADRALAARALVYLGACYERLGNEKARQAYRRVIEQFPDQRAAARQARVRLAALDRTSQSLQLTLRRLWSQAPPRDLDWAGPPSADGRVLPMFDEDRRLVLMDIALDRRPAALPVAQASPNLPACVIWSDVVLSPGNREAAFDCEVAGRGYELRVASLDPGHPSERRVASGSIEPIEWRHAGQILAQILSGPGSPALVVVSPRDGSVHRVASLHGPVAYASISPDGRWVAYDAPESTAALRRDVIVAPVDGGGAVTLSSPASDDLLPAWTPDGRGIVLVSDRTGTPGLWLQHMDAGRPVGSARLLSQDLGRVAGAWGLTPDGGFVYFRQTGLVDVQIVDLDSTGRPLGSPRSASSRIGASMWPAWSRDGSKLAYETTPLAAHLQGITILDVASGGERIVPMRVPLAQHLHWSRDGRSLALRGRDSEGRYGLYIVDVATGRMTAARTVDRNDETSLGTLAWDIDGRSLLYHYQGELRRLDTQSGADAPVTSSEPVAFAGPFDVLPSDGSIAFSRRVAGVGQSLAIRRPDGSIAELLRPNPGERFGPPVWMPDGRAVLFTRTRSDRALPSETRRPSLWRLDVATSTARPLGLSLDGLRSLAVSSDGRHLAFVSGSPALEPWIVEHFLPGPAATARNR
jgi:Tol biopolymer transport system component